MKKMFHRLPLVFSLVACILCTLLAGCQKKETLHLYCWADYIDPELIAEFEKLNHCHVVYDTFDSNEALLAKLEAGATGYDLIVPSSYIIPILIQHKLVAPVDHSRLTLLPHLDEEMLKGMPDQDHEYCIPYAMSYTGIGYNNTAIKDFVPNWDMYMRTNLQKRATLLDDKREVIGAALLHLGLNVNSTDAEDLQKAKELILKWTKNITKFENEQYKNGIASNELLLVQGYSGDMMQVVAETPFVSFALPEEGVAISCDAFAIPVHAPNMELAYKFLNFLYTPENMAKDMEYTWYLHPNKDAYSLLPEELRNNPAIFMDPELRKKSDFIVDQGEKEILYNKLWAEIKAGL